MKKFYITTPIYYASGNLHIGHLYTTTLAWVIANYKKKQGYDVRMLTGSDEHGNKINEKALEQNKTPQKLVDEISQKFIQMWKDFDINYTYFWRTTNQIHKNSVQKIFSFFLNKGYIYKDKYEGYYSVSDEEFLTLSQAIKKDGNYYHPVSMKQLEYVSEESYFFAMDKFIDWWKSYISTHKSFLWPKKTENELIKNFIDEGIQNLSVTRTKVKWGIPAKEDINHTLYVWLDALCNYITVFNFDVDNYQNNKDFNDFWNSNDAEVVHILGKEISRFHMIYWPIFLQALGLKQPSRIQSHGWILDAQGRKMSKSLNNVVDPYELLKKYHPEMIKYFLVSQINIGEDGLFDENRFIDVINSELINNFGNLVSRTLKMKSNVFNYESLKYYQTNDRLDLELEDKITNSLKDFIFEFDNYRLDKAFKVAINLSNYLNKYIDETKPWTLSEQRNRLSEILIRLLNGIYAVASYLEIVLPNKINEVKQALGVGELNFNFISDFKKFDNTLQQKEFILFTRIKK
ncbi:methionine--tRNA ligase [Mycoplasma leonicaptivi]|uniref:methionine--tRNA ligase n=1 Tax=Mycoplasma leonicaptivi TaxID=36742 RepID=UPI00048024B8|nr:methionine--tRNA ligase [Mycoplasma leonicaptivi]